MRSIGIHVSGPVPSCVGILQRAPFRVNVSSFQYNGADVRASDDRIDGLEREHSVAAEGICAFVQLFSCLIAKVHGEDFEDNGLGCVAHTLRFGRYVEPRKPLALQRP